MDTQRPILPVPFSADGLPQTDLSGAELAAVRVTLRRELRRRPVANDDRTSTRNLLAALARLDTLGDGPVAIRRVR